MGGNATFSLLQHGPAGPHAASMFRKSALTLCRNGCPLAAAHRWAARLPASLPGCLTRTGCGLACASPDGSAALARVQCRARHWNPVRHPPWLMMACCLRKLAFNYCYKNCGAFNVTRLITQIFYVDI